jgi:hypothetical protein
MNSVRKNQLLIPPNRGPRKVVVEKTPEAEDGTVFEDPGGRTETHAVTKTIIMVPDTIILVA